LSGVAHRAKTDARPLSAGLSAVARRAKAEALAKADAREQGRIMVIGLHVIRV